MHQSPSSPDSTPRSRLPFVALFAGNSVSAFGNSLTALAIPLFVLETTGSYARTGFVGAAGLLPIVLATAFGSAAVDRFGHKRMSVLSDGLSLVSVALIPVLYLADALTFPMLITLIFLGAFFDAPGGTARVAMLPDVSRIAGMPLERANAMSQGIGSIATMAGPLAAGVLVAVIGASNVLFFNAMTFAVSALLVALFVPNLSIKTEASTTSYVEEVKIGWRFLFRDHLLRTIALAATVINFLLAPLATVLLPIFTDMTTGDARTLGVLLGGFGVGGLVSTVLFGAFGPRLPRRLVLIGSLTAVAAPLGVLATFPPWWFALVATVTMGFVLGPVNPLVFTILQERVPVELRGRVFGAIMASALVAAPLGVGLAGVLVSLLGLSTIFTIMAVGMAALGGVLFISPHLRDLSPVPNQADPSETRVDGSAERPTPSISTARAD